MIPGRAGVLVVGGGHAALCAAITAKLAGADVVLLECAPKAQRGGNSSHTRNLRVAHEGPLLTLTERYDEQTFWQDLQAVTGGRTDETLARIMIHGSNELLLWLRSQGVHFQPALKGTLNLAHSNAFFLGGGKALVNALYAKAQALGVAICYDTQVSGLTMIEGEFDHAIVDSPHGTQKIEADTVIVASGGFQANETWMREAWGPAADNFLIRGTRFNTGVVLRSLLDQGADSVSDPRQCHAVAIDARAPKYDGGIVSRLDCVCFSVVVNKRGERFYDEGEDFWPKRYAIWGRLVAEQPDQIAYSIIDAKVKDEFMPSVFAPIQAPTIRELAQKLGLHGDELELLIDEFNRAVGPGQFDATTLDGCATSNLSPNKSNWAQRIDTPPFQAYPLSPGITFTYLGLAVNEHAQVMFNGLAARNVFAAGEVMAGNILGQGYCAGTGMSIGGVFGRIAGEQAACISR